ncbi:MAG TPA: hypothetical protein VFE51_20985 [Verrucomicrobiae bacterium]|nr:hypothetical protein [Verrucomicrobiae bacterium]
MQQPFTITGGAQIGWVNASWPLARLSATSDQLAIKARVLGNYSFTPEQVSAVERYALIPFLAWGVRIRHQVPDYPRRIIFWCFNDPTTVLQGIRDAGFNPKGIERANVQGAGIPSVGLQLLEQSPFGIFFSLYLLSVRHVVVHLRAGVTFFPSMQPWSWFSPHLNLEPSKSSY